ncbi:MAG: Uma2 family endonuclease [Tepidisphaeraceae bacterium]
MTLIDRPVGRASTQAEDGQRFVFPAADWAFYEQVGRQLAEQRVFVTYYKGRLEAARVSYLHERIVALLAQLVWVLAEETNREMVGAGMTTLQRADLEEGIEPDSSFYIAHVERMRSRKEIDLANDPPPDLAIEVEVTHRLAERKSIYRDIGVGEVWVHGKNGLTILLRKDEQYEAADRSPTFPQLSAAEMSALVTAGLNEGGVSWIKSVRRRVQEAVSGGQTNE